MINEQDNFGISEAYNALMGYQYKITKAPAMNPTNGRIYLAGTVQSGSTVKGRLYGLDIKSTDQQPAMKVAFEQKLSAGPESCPFISPDDTHIYLFDKKGTLYAFDQEGVKMWTLQLDIIPKSPAITEDGTIYACSGNKLYAIKDLGSSGAFLWVMDFKELLSDRLTDWVPSRD